MSVVRHPDPRHEFGDAVGWMTLGNSRQNISQPGFGIDAIELGSLCRTANYAERCRKAASFQMASRYKDDWHSA